MTKIKVALLAVMLAIGTTKLPAPPWGGGQTCSQITSNWSCSVSIPQTGINQFTIAANNNFLRANVYLNNVFIGSTPYSTFSFPSYIHGSFSVDVFSNVGGCIRSFGPFQL